MGFFRRLLFGEFGPTQKGRIHEELTKDVKTHCKFCGNKDVVKVYINNFFDTSTGKQNEIYLLECPVSPCRHSGCFYPNESRKISTTEINCIRCGHNKYDGD